MNLWVVSTSTGRLRRVTGAHLNWDPAFTRDGRIIWSSNRSGNYEIWIADPDGSAAKQITRDGSNAENPTATPDGEWIIYSSGNPEKPGLWKIRVDGTEATHLFGGRATIPEVSPDGRHAVFRSFTGKYPARLRVARLDGGGRESPRGLRDPRRGPPAHDDLPGPGPLAPRRERHRLRGPGRDRRHRHLRPGLRSGTGHHRHPPEDRGLRPRRGRRVLRSSPPMAPAWWWRAGSSSSASWKPKA